MRCPMIVNSNASRLLATFRPGLDKGKGAGVFNNSNQKSRGSCSKCGDKYSPVHTCKTKGRRNMLAASASEAVEELGEEGACVEKIESKKARSFLVFFGGYNLPRRGDG